MLKNDIIDNIIEVNSLDIFPGLIGYIEGAEIGDRIVNNILIKIEKTISIEEMKQYLNDTEWVENYYIKHLLGLELIPDYSSKWAIISTRIEYKQRLK